MKGEAVQQILPLASLGQDGSKSRSFDCAQDDRLPLGVTTFGQRKRNGKGSECVFVSMSVFPFLFR